MVLAPPNPASALIDLADLADHAGDRVEVLRERSVAELHERLRRLSRVDVVIDARLRNADRQWRRWLSLFFHLQPGGQWTALHVEGEPALAARISELRERVAADRPGRRLVEPASAIADVRVSDDRVTIVKSGVHLLKLRDAEASDVLADRAPELTVTELQRVAGGRLEQRGRVTSHGGDVDDLAAPVDYPPLHLRRYEGRIDLLEGAVARHGTSLLPDTYRWHLQDVPINKRLVDINAEWARTRRHEPVRRHLDGAFYYFDYKNPGHYGHVLTEAVSRLWGWPAAKAADPDLKFLLRRGARDARSSRPRPELTLLPAFGIDSDDVVWIDESVSVNSLVGLTPMWHNKSPYSGHPGIRDVWARLRAGLPAAAVPDAPRIFVTRDRTGHRACHNAAEVEQFFAERGFAIVQPASMTIPEQAATFAQARVVAGFAGTGMFNLAFARDVESVVVLSHSAYDARNERLMAALLGADAHYFWGEPDIQHPEGGWSYEAFQSSWAFDLARHRQPLEGVLAGP